MKVKETNLDRKDENFPKDEIAKFKFYSVQENYQTAACNCGIS